LQYLFLPICHYWPGVGFRLAFGIGFAESVKDASLKLAAKTTAKTSAKTSAKNKRMLRGADSRSKQGKKRV